MDARTKALLGALQSVLHENDFRRVVNHIMYAALRLTDAEAASLFLVNRRRKRLEMAASTNLARRVMDRIGFSLEKGVAGCVAMTGQSANIEDIAKDPRHYAGVGKLTGFTTRGYLCVPLRVGPQILGTIQVLNRRHGGRFSDADQELLEAFALIASIALQKSRMHEAELQKRRMEVELSVAHAFQQKMLPHAFDPPPALEVAACNLPARQMGGDLYDGFQVADRYCVAVGDVSGKGPGAALWMASLSSLLRFLAEQHHDPLRQMPIVDAHLARTMPMGSFITLFLASIEGDTLLYSNAGHNPPLLVRRDGSIATLGATGVPIGVFPDLPRDIQTTSFLAGDRLVLYTDGVVEAQRPNGEMYGDDRLIALLGRLRTRTADEAVRGIVRSVKRFSTPGEPIDDITVMVIDRRVHERGSTRVTGSPVSVFQGCAETGSHS